MQRIKTISELRELVAVWREAGESVALVPTMGNLHKGHMSLVHLAGEHAERVIVSIFVNPTQFAPDEDYADYPRTAAVDARRLSRAGVDVLFEPEISEIYPGNVEGSAQVVVQGLSSELEGAFRPEHFVGVTSVVNRLMNVCAPDIAVFGQKDYQQLVVLRRMVNELHMLVTVLAGPTERAKSGLALSSRNSYLSDEQQAQAGAIYKTLCIARDKLADGSRDYAAIEAEGNAALCEAGIEPDYFTIRAARDLTAPDEQQMNLVIVVAARLGGVRLIDNVLVSL